MPAQSTTLATPGTQILCADPQELFPGMLASMMPGLILITANFSAQLTSINHSNKAKVSV